MLKIRQVPILQDNYSHLLIDTETREAAAVDPAEPGPVLAALTEEGARLTHVLCTHHHRDHSGGNMEILAKHPGVEVVGSVDDAGKIPGLTRRVSEQDTLRVGQLQGRILLVPCHTRGHIAYLFQDALFCGDTLFVAGCGRFFEGDARQMHHALNEVFARLPPSTRVFCGHEYTVSNLRFALSIEPGNAAAREKLAWAEAQRAKALSTVPSTIGEELSFNPFMRVSHPAVARAVGAEDPIEVMDRLRTRKNEFRA